MKMVLITIWILLASAPVAADRTDLSGTYDVGTLTPLQRPEAFGENLYLSPEQAEQMAQRVQSMMTADAAKADPNRDAPLSGDGGEFSKGYNMFWIDLGTTAATVDGKFRTSIITHPANGRIPQMTQQGAQRLQGMLDRWEIVWRTPDPTAGNLSSVAWWLTDGDPDGPYDHIEQRPLAERCILGSRSTAGPPLLPNLYNNFKRIIQTQDHVMILTEMNHDARIVRMNAKHRPEHVRTWLGDSIGHWEEDVLVVDTTNFAATPALSGADKNLHVVERFARQADGGLRYSFTVTDPTVWSEPWSGEYTWRAAAEKVYEYACHEGNYALGNILRGARLLEQDAAAITGG